MIRLIIVEDERLIRNGIKNHVPWQMIGVDEVRTAENAEEALATCETYRPDIILSDIRMPGMNGIELCIRFRERLPESQIIFISGFSDKEYLMAAISLGAAGYVMKPIAIPELVKAVEKALATVKMRSRQNNGMLHSLLCALQAQKERVPNSLGFYSYGKFLSDDHAFRVVLLKSKSRIVDAGDITNRFQEKLRDRIQDCDIHFTADFINQNLIAVLLSGRLRAEAGSPDLSKRVAEALLNERGEGDNWFLGFGKVTDSLDHLPDSYQSAENALRSLSFKGWNSFAFYDEDRREWQGMLPEDIQNRFHKLLLSKKESEASALLNEICRYLAGEHAVLNFHVRNLFYTLDGIVAKSGRALRLGGEVTETGPGTDFLDDVQTISEMQEYVRRHVKTMLEESGTDQEICFVVMKVRDYMNQNLQNQNLSIQLLADTVSLTPTYLSNLFKKKTGITIGQYLTELRMERAKNLLRDPHLKLYQVAEGAGYKDSNYFSRIFRKKTGMLPSAYRESKSV